MRRQFVVRQEFDLEGKVAIVAGGGRGLGKNIALRLAENGADVVVASRTASQVEQAAAQIRQMGRKSLAVVADVAQTAQVENMVKATVAEFGKVDILAIVAGFSIKKPLVPLAADPPAYVDQFGKSVPLGAEIKLDVGLTDEDWESVTNTDILGVVRCARAVGPHMIAQKSGKVIIMGSGVGITGNEVFHTPYAACKAGIHNFARALALEWNPYNIQVNVVTPGNIGRFTAPDGADPAAEDNPRGGNMRAVGFLTAFLASNASDFISGQTICCNTRGRAAQP